MEKKINKQVMPEEMPVEMEQLEAEEELSQVAGGFRQYSETGANHDHPGKPMPIADKK